MFRINERNRNENGQKNDRKNRRRHWEHLPADQIKHPRENLDNEVAHRNRSSALPALPPLKEPSQNRDVLPRRELRLAVRTKRTLGVVH